MRGESAFFYFLLGLLAYRTFDFIAAHHKIAQTLNRLDKSKLGVGQMGRSAGFLLRLCQWIFDNAVTIALVGLLLIFASFGIAGIANSAGKHLAPSLVLSAVTSIVSIAISFASYVNEALRLQLDRIS